eukprot:5992443-Pyramimonas_sp.AAC.1
MPISGALARWIAATGLTIAAHHDVAAPERSRAVGCELRAVSISKLSTFGKSRFVTGSLHG